MNLTYALNALGMTRRPASGWPLLTNDVLTIEDSPDAATSELNANEFAAWLDEQSLEYTRTSRLVFRLGEPALALVCGVLGPDVYLVWPQEGFVDGPTIAGWYVEAIENGEVEGSSEAARSVKLMAAALSDAGIITLGRASNLAVEDDYNDDITEEGQIG